jgi:hypothetical protein
LSLAVLLVQQNRDKTQQANIHNYRSLGRVTEHLIDALQSLKLGGCFLQSKQGQMFTA